MSNLVKVDLEKLFSLTYSFDPLKIFLGGVQNSIEQQAAELSEFKKKIETDIAERLEKIEEKLKSHEEEIGQSKMKMETLQSTSEIHSEVLKQHSNEINELKTILSGLGSQNGEPADQNILKEILNLKQNQSIIQESVKQLNDTVDDLNRKSSEIQEIQSQTTSKVNEHDDHLRKHEEEIKAIMDTLQGMEGKVAGKVDVNEHKKLMTMLDEIRKKLVDMKIMPEMKIDIPPNGPSLNENEVNLLRALAEKSVMFEDQISKLWKAIKEMNIDKLRNQVDSIDKALDTKVDVKNIDSLINQIESMKKLIEELRNNLLVLNKRHDDNIFGINSKIEDLNNQIRMMNKNILDLRDKIGKDIKPSTQQIIDARNDGKNFDEEELSQIRKIIESHEKLIKRLREEMDELRNLLQNKIRYLEEIIAKKVDFDDLDKLKRELIQYFEAIINGLQKKFADKNETKKALQALEKQIKAILEIIMKDQNDSGETAMFSKKPLQGYACASCEKNLVNLQGQIAAYNNWNKLPMRDPTERLAKVGAGFSRMLSMLKPENVSKYKISNMSKQRIKQDGSDNEMYAKDPAFDNKDDEFSQRPSTSSHLPDIQGKKN